MLRIILTGLFLVWSVACGAAPQKPSEGEPVTSPLPEQGSPLPPSTTQGATGSSTEAPAYPAPALAVTSAYPAPETGGASVISYMPFSINRPVLAGAKEVSGTGPAGVPIIIADFTQGVQMFGVGTINSDGTFLIDLKAPLEADQQIGIMIGDLAGSKWEGVDFRDPKFHGQEFKEMPDGVFYLDTVLVTSP